jgi:hypothetical protein
MDEYTLKEIKKAGIDYTKLTKEQLYAISVPIIAPENYYQDGEISSERAYYLHSQRLIQCGIVGKTYVKAMSLI